MSDEATERLESQILGLEVNVQERDARIEELEATVNEQHATIEGLTEDLAAAESKVSEWEDWAKERRSEADALERALGNTP